MRYLSYCILLLYSVISLACADSDISSAAISTEITLIVEVQNIELEGGFYGLVTQDGQKYRPQALPELYQQTGLWIKIRAKRVNQLGFYMWGQTINITHICAIPCIQSPTETQPSNGI